MFFLQIKKSYIVSRKNKTYNISIGEFYEKNVPVLKEDLERSFDSLGRQAVFLNIYEMPEEEYNYYYNNDALGEISW